MRGPVRRLGRSAPALLLGALLTLGGAQAQDLTAYGNLARSVDRLTALSAQGDAGALAPEFQAASQAFRGLDPTLTDRSLVLGLSRNLTTAQQRAPSNPVETQANFLLARGLMRKALAEQSLAELRRGEARALTETRLRLIASEFGLDSGSYQALRRDAFARHLNLVAWRLEAAAARKALASLEVVQSDTSAASYLNLTRAASWFTVIQTQGRAQTPPLTTEQFEAALRQLTAGDTAALGSSLAGLRERLSALRDRVSVRPAPVVSPLEGAGGSGPTPPNSTSPSSTPPGSAPSPTASYAAAYAPLGRALSASAVADLPRARAELLSAATTVQQLQESRRAGGQPTQPGLEQLRSDLQRLAGRPAPRRDEVQALLGELSRLEGEAGATSSFAASGPGAFSVSLTRWLAGLRPLLALLLALACAAPLYLLTLAFGRRNPSWRAISTGLWLLLAPLLLEGLGSALGYLGGSGVGALAPALNFTLTQGAYGLFVYGLLSALGLAFLTYGFWGLCRQFGLLGKHQTARTPTQLSKTTLDWEEEI